MTKYVVYKLNYTNDFYYIGVTNNLQRRLKEHGITKNGHTLISSEIIDSFDNEDLAYDREKCIVTEEVVTDPFCLNVTRGGKHPYNMRLGVPHSAETKAKISQTKKGVKYNLSEEQRRHRSKLSRERMLVDNIIHHPGAREKMANTLRGRAGTMLGKKLTVEQHAKISYNIQTPDGVFPSTVAAAKFYRVSQQTISNRCSSPKFEGWLILSKGQKYT